MLVNGLRPEAAIFRVGGQQWTTQDELLSIAIERIDHWGLYAAYMGSDKKFHKHLPDASLLIPRPGEETRSERDERDRVVTDPREIAAFFG